MFYRQRLEGNDASSEDASSPPRIGWPARGLPNRGSDPIIDSEVDHRQTYQGDSALQYAPDLRHPVRSPDYVEELLPPWSERVAGCDRGHRLGACGGDPNHRSGASDPESTQVQT